MKRRIVFTSLTALAFAAPFAPAACSSSPGPSTASGSGGSSGSSTASSGGSAGGGGMVDGGACSSGEACGDGGICTGSVCCDVALVCGQACCPASDVCSFQKCVTPGAPCHDSSDCGADSYCEHSLGDNADAGAADASCMGGAAQLSGKCLPRPATCAADADAGAPDAGALDCLEQCDYHPSVGFTPVAKFAWGGQVTSPYASDVMMTPIVVQLDDDDCDGKITEKDIPEILFTTFSGGNYGTNGVLHAISIVAGAVVEKWSAAGINPSGSLAGGDIDGVPGNEVIACGDGGFTIAYRGDGTILWTAKVACYMPSIADMDGDGVPEVIVDSGILDGATGALKHAFTPALPTPLIVSDLDGDGKLDVITATRGYHADGSLFIDTQLTPNWSWPAIADFDGDGAPEVVYVDNLTHTIAVWRAASGQPGGFAMVRAPIDMNAPFATNPCPPGSWGADHGGGPPTVADFNGDGTPDVGLAGGIGYVVFDGKKLLDPALTGPQTILWSAPTTDCSSASTGSSVFDFDGDGKAEVVYSDENTLRIYDGTNGNVLFSTCNTTGTLVEYPVIADVDNDGHADIVVVSNAYASGNPEYACQQGPVSAYSGVRVFGDESGTWVRTRRIWNEHAYHVTNVNEDGTIPAHEASNWTQPGLNNFRQNKQPGSEFSAPDAVVTVAGFCGSGGYSIVATVRNIGQAALPAGAVVGFYQGMPPAGLKLGSSTTTKVLYPAESETLTLPLAAPDPGLLNGKALVYALFDDGSPAHPSWHECRTDNNTGGPSSVACDVPH